MTKRIIIVALLFAFLVAEADAQNRYRRRGVIFGGLAGAAIGAAIGDRGDNETAGALIGGAVGAIAGGKIGSNKDARIEHNRRYHSGHYYTTPQPYYDQHGYHHVQPGYPVYREPVVVAPQPVIQPVTVADVIQMQHRGIAELTMIRLIQTHGVAVKPSVSEVIDMHEQGVSERVIAAMQGDPVSSFHALPDAQYRAPNTHYQEPTLAAPLN